MRISLVERAAAAGAGMEGEEGRSSKRSAAAKKPRTKQLLCEQDPEAPGLTLEQRRKIRRHAPHVQGSPLLTSHVQKGSRSVCSKHCHISRVHCAPGQPQLR